MGIEGRRNTVLAVKSALETVDEAARPVHEAVRDGHIDLGEAVSILGLVLRKALALALQIAAAKADHGGE